MRVGTAESRGQERSGAALSLSNNWAEVEAAKLEWNALFRQSIRNQIDASRSNPSNVQCCSVSNVTYKYDLISYRGKRGKFAIRHWKFQFIPIVTGCNLLMITYVVKWNREAGFCGSFYVLSNKRLFWLHWSLYTTSILRRQSCLKELWWRPR